MNRPTRLAEVEERRRRGRLSPWRKRYRAIFEHGPEHYGAIDGSDIIKRHGKLVRTTDSAGIRLGRVLVKRFSGAKSEFSGSIVKRQGELHASPHLLLNLIRGKQA